MPTIVVSSWIVLTVLLGAAAWIAAWSRRQTKARALGIITFLAGSPVAAFAVAVCLGWPMPLIAGITGPSGDYTVLGSKLIPGQAIYVLIDVGNEPRYYVLPWDQGAAETLQDASDNGSGVNVTVPPMEFSWEQRKPLSFHELPQPKVLPDKPRQQEPVARLDSI